MSSIKSIQIDEATPAQIAAFARNFLNLDVSPEASDDQILSRVKAAQPGIATIFVMADEFEEVERINPPLASQVLEGEAQNVDRLAGSLGRDDPRAIISIMSVESEDGRGSEDVPIGVNGRIWQLQRGKDLNVPWRVVEALRRCVQTIVRHDDEGNVTEREAARYPFTILQSPSQQEIADWHERTDGAFCP
jgi:hypothetical protein